ncbi:MAG: hypothetical protein ACODTL_20500 [Brucella sp.]|nr:hypothetical protein [Bacillus sp. PR5]
MNNVPHTLEASAFMSSPLITPQRILGDHLEAFDIKPDWVRSVRFETPEGYAQAVSHIYEPQPTAIVILGKGKVSHKNFSLCGLAVAFELTRFPGMSMVSNSNGNKPNERFYVRLAIADCPEDLTTFGRILSASGPDEEITSDIFKHELRPEHLKKRLSSKGNKDAREVVMTHINRIVRKMEDNDRFRILPFTAAEYVANLKTLLDAVDREAEGIDLAQLFPVAPSGPKGGAR